MKQCPQCKTEYFDNLLDFCLEDGAKLVTVFENSGAREDTTHKTNPFNPTETETVVLQDNILKIDNIVSDLHETNVWQKQLRNKSEKIKDSVKDKWFNVLEFAPIVLALTHVYWQWLYLSKQNYYRFTEYIISANFLIWFALLICGVIFGIISLKYGKSKKFAVTALTILAINLLLILLPKQN